jgi:DNA-binding transcriptional MerR regulator
MPESPVVPTVGSIADRLGVSVHRIRYVIASRKIKPSGRAGQARVFTEADVNRIACELSRIEAEKGGGHV